MSGSSEGAAAAGMPTSTQHQLAGTGSPVSEPGQPAGPKQPKTRSRMGCMTCRKRTSRASPLPSQLDAACLPSLCPRGAAVPRDP